MTNVRAPVGAATLRKLISPRSVAVVGASSDATRIGGRPIAYLKRSFAGRILPVNPKHTTVQGIAAAPSLRELPEVPDLAILAVQAPEVPALLEECARLGVGAAVVFSAGFAEAGADGAALQAHLVSVARASGVRLLGPNCLGLMNLREGMLATFAASPVDLPTRLGPVAIVSQSGALGATLFQAAQRTGIGVSYSCSTGNEADVTVAELLAYLVEQPDVGVLLAYAEGVKDPHMLVTAARRARALGKPLVFLKAGRSEAGARAAASHTAAIVGEDAVYDAVFRQLGVLRPESPEEMLDLARVFAAGRAAPGNRVGIVTVSGGAGILMADAAVRAGLAVPALRGDDRARIAALIPGFGAADNPVDCTGQVVNDRRLLGTVLQALAETSSLDSLCLFLGLADPLDERLAAPVVEVAAATPKAVAAWCGSAQAAATMTERGVPTYTDPTRAMRALGALARWASPTGADEQRTDSALRGSGPALRLVAADHPFLLEHTALALLASLGLRVPRTRVVRSEDEASTAAAELDWPLALKALSYDLPHRSDAGGVQLGLRSEHELRDAYRAIVRSVAEKAPAARLEAMLVAEMAPGGLELACGMRRDPTFGPMVGVGLGGYAVEIIGEMALRRAPLTEAEALRALADVHGGRLIGSRRGPSRQQQADIARVLVTIGDLALREPAIQEIDLNPVIAAADGSVWVVDALVLLTPAPG